MLIRTQDWMSLVNMSRIEAITIEPTGTGPDGLGKEGRAINAYFGSEINDEPRWLCLGQYENEDKAVEVLDMIQKEYQRHYHSAGGYNYELDVQTQSFGYTPPKVFQMPQDLRRAD